MKFINPMRKSAIIMALVSSAVLLVPASPASASDWSRSCYEITSPYKGISEIMGSVRMKSSNCKDGSVSLQRHRWWGWQVVDDERLTGGTTYVMFSCHGTGTYTYKTTFTTDAQLATYESAERRWTC
ncbi:hypothetical protein [Nocardiopsis lucentensis]|uniref:hypothetical protein n=1 Tax=Nocardiopsis lucentensis TaxID=53441 RepID=UPI000476CE4E|nr:hypothetical protein [Nocardiopsis lucentensis]